MNLIGTTEFSPWVQSVVGLVLMFTLAFGSKFVSKPIIIRSFSHWREIFNSNISTILLNDKVGIVLSQLLPSLMIQITVSLIPHLPNPVTTVIKNVAVAVTILQTIRIILAMLDAFQTTYSQTESKSSMSSAPVKSYIQLSKLLIVGLGIIIIISVLIDRSPLILLSSLGALSAVLLIVFKDTLTSFTAGLQLSSNNMLRVGDWIEMPELGADGDVIDIALHTVKVQNWDKTITSIPTWRLMSSSFKNWRGMSESGGRRIKRNLLIDASTIKFLTDSDIDRLKKINIITSYLTEKTTDISQSNKKLISNFDKANELNLINHRRLTNLGTFRAYVNLYLFEHKKIHKNMTILVRLLRPESEGIPLEIYCFTSTTNWIEYEAIQSDIFEHLLAILSEFELSAFQRPAGKDLRGIKNN